MRGEGCTVLAFPVGCLYMENSWGRILTIRMLTNVNHTFCHPCCKGQVTMQTAPFGCQGVAVSKVPLWEIREVLDHLICGASDHLSCSFSSRGFSVEIGMLWLGAKYSLTGHLCSYFRVKYAIPWRQEWGLSLLYVFPLPILPVYWPYLLGNKFPRIREFSSE